MITAKQIAPYKTAIDYEDTEAIKAELSLAKEKRQPFYLTAKELDRILKWKLRSQYGRQKELRKANTEENINLITKMAFSISNSDPEYEIELRFGILCLLKGVGVPVASAILALSFSDQYMVIDYRVWRQVFNEEKNNFSISDYKKYLQEVKRLAEELNWTLQEVDMAIWEYDKVHN